MHTPSTGAFESPKDLRTFSYPLGVMPPKIAGVRYSAKDIEDQGKCGTCTATSVVMNAQRATGKNYSDDFQYLLQKKFIDKNWIEGSSIFSALKAAKNYGLLPQELWTFTTQADKNAGYTHYTNKLKEVSATDIQNLLTKTEKVLTAYASVPVHVDMMKSAIASSKAGILVRYECGPSWYTSPSGVLSWNKKDLEPLRKPKVVISGHAVTISNYDGGSYRIGNSWGVEWCDSGTGYSLFNTFLPSECWAVFYDVLPPEIEKQIEDKEERSAIVNKILELLNSINELLRKL